MKGRIKIFGILAVMMLVVPMTAIAQTSNLETSLVEIKEGEDALEDIVEFNEEKYIDTVEFFENECPDEVPALEQALNKATIEDENGNIIALDLSILEEELSKPIGSRTRLRFFREEFIESDKGKYQNIRNPYDNPYWGGPILGKYAIKWAFKSDSYEIKCFNDWRDRPGDVPEPIGNPNFYCKKIWFHDWAPGWHYDWREVKIGGVVTHVFALGKTDPNARFQQLRNPIIYRLLLRLQNTFPVLGKLLIV